MSTSSDFPPRGWAAPDPHVGKPPVPFQSILVATDFSACAERATHVGTSWAAALGAKLEIAHVFETPTRALPSGTPWIGDAERTRHGAELATHLEAVASACRRRVERTTGVLLTGRTYDALVRHAVETGVDLIVLGAHGLGMLERTLLGSVADRVLRTAACSVLVVPDVEVAPTPRSIVVPTDFSPNASAAWACALDVARVFGADVEVVHAWERPRDAPRHGGVADDVEGAVLARIRASHPLGCSTHVRHVAREGTPTEVILALVADTHANLVVVSRTGEHKLGARLLGSITDRLVRSASVPVLVFRPPQR